MTPLHIAYYIAIIYISCVIGVYIKFRMHGVKGAIYVHVMVAPVYMLLLTPIYAFRRRFTESKGTLVTKLKKAIKLVMLAYKFFPVLVALEAQDIAKHENKRKKIKYTLVIGGFKPYYAGFNTLSNEYLGSKTI